MGIFWLSQSNFSNTSFTATLIVQGYRPLRPERENLQSWRGGWGDFDVRWSYFGNDLMENYVERCTVLFLVYPRWEAISCAAVPKMPVCCAFNCEWRGWWDWPDWRRSCSIFFEVRDWSWGAGGGCCGSLLLVKERLMLMTIVYTVQRRVDVCWAESV